MSLHHVKELIANVKAGRASSGWLADMAAIELGAVEDALAKVMTGVGARTPASEYSRAKNLLERVAREAA